MIITAPPTSDDDHSNDYALELQWGIKDVLIRNVVIYHAANGMGIFGWKSTNVRLENVKVIAYGNEWGAQPCP